MQIFNRRAQNLMEYTLLMAGAVAISIVALRQGGLVDKTVNKSLDVSVSGVECMALNTCYDPDGCPAVCGNGCCEAHAETAGSCWADCECSNPLECDDGIYCNGVEECGGNQHCRHGASLGAGKDAGLCVACDGSGGELAVLDDPECGSIDCSGHNYFHHAATTADATDVETCLFRAYAAITSGRCDGIRRCKEPDSANCAAYGDNPEYSCGICKYIADSDCTGMSPGVCSPSSDSSECGTRVCDLLDVSCRNYHDVTRYCDGAGNCATPECTAYTDAVDGTYVNLCTVCDGGGAERMAVDDEDCGPIICAGYNYYFQTGDESPTATETCTYRSYLDVTAERCAAMGVCKTADAGICLGYDDSYPYSCGTCQYIAEGDCVGSNKGSCSNYAAGTDAGLCIECNGAGSEKAGADDTGCGVIDCDGLNFYSQSGEESSTGTEICTYRDYADIESNRCEGMNDCKDANSPDCKSYGEAGSYSCGICQFIAAADCTGTTQGGCSNYADGTLAQTCAECDGSGAQRAIADDARCGTIDCTGLDYYYSEVSAKDSDVQTCYQKVHADLTTDRCAGINECKTGIEANCTESTPVFQYTCGVCKEIGPGVCEGKSPGICLNSNTSTTCGTKDCDGLDTKCRDYHDVTRYCDGAGGCTDPVCDSYTDLDTSTACGTKDCDPLDVTCRNYHDVTNYCDGAGSCGESACAAFTNAVAGTDAGLCTECDGSGGTRAAADDGACAAVMCTELNYYTKTTAADPDLGDDVCYHREYVDISTDKCQALGVCKNKTDCTNPTDVHQYTCGVCQYIADTDCTATTKGGCSNTAAAVDTGVCAECNGIGGERAPADDAGCGTIDCSGLDHYRQIGSESPIGTETCLLRTYTDITADRCEGLKDCKDANTSDCATYAETTQYACGTCQYIADTDCTGASKGGCTNYDTLAVCGTKDCDTLDTPCRDYHDLTRYCDGAGGCTDPVCNSYTDYDTSTACGTKDCDYLDALPCRDYNDVTHYCDGYGSCVESVCDNAYADAADGTYVGVCAVCDGKGKIRAAADDGACKLIMCHELNGFVKGTLTTPTGDVEACYRREYSDMSKDRCEGVGDCKDKDVADCANFVDMAPFTCPTCQALAGCSGSTPGNCAPVAAGTDVGTCAECDGKGTMTWPADDAACGANIDCDGMDKYVYTAASGVTLENCKYRNYDDITDKRCEGVNNCKDANTADCTVYTDGAALTCPKCKYITGCSGSTPGSCTNYSNHADTGLCSECDGSGNEVMAADDAACANVACSSIVEYYPSYANGTGSSATGEDQCLKKNYTDISTNRCKAINACKTTGDCVSNGTSVQQTCGLCKYITGCSGTTQGDCGFYSAGTSCGGDSVCDGNGNCAKQQCLASTMAVSVNGLTGTFAGTSVGATSTATCPAGYNYGSPTRWCNAVTNAANGSWDQLQTPCMRNCQGDTMAVGTQGLMEWYGETPVGQTKTSVCPSGSSQNANGAPYRWCNADSNSDGFGEWGDLLNECVPNACIYQVLDIGSGKKGAFPATASGSTGYSSCPTGYSGNPSRSCSFGVWGGLNDGCLPNGCTAQDLDIGSGLTGTFPAVASGSTGYSSCPTGYSGTPGRLCSLGKWGMLTNGCAPAGCSSQSLDIGSGKTGTFPAAGHNQSKAISCPLFYTGSPTRTCSYGNWGPLSSGCVPACGDGTCDPYYENKTKCPADCGVWTALSSAYDCPSTTTCNVSRDCSTTCPTFNPTGITCSIPTTSSCSSSYYCRWKTKSGSGSTNISGITYTCK